MEATDAKPLLFELEEREHAKVRNNSQWGKPGQLYVLYVLYAAEAMTDYAVLAFVAEEAPLQVELLCAQAVVAEGELDRGSFEAAIMGLAETMAWDHKAGVHSPAAEMWRSPGFWGFALVYEGWTAGFDSREEADAAREFMLRTGLTLEDHPAGQECRFALAVSRQGSAVGLLRRRGVGAVKAVSFSTEPQGELVAALRSMISVVVGEV